MDIKLLNEWEIIEEEFKAEDNYINETIFSLGNGYIGMRGNLEEGFQGLGVEGTYINGFYESQPITYGEACYGYAEKSQTMVNVTNSKTVKLFVEDEEFNMFKGEVLNYRRVLNFKEGLLKRNLKWRSPSGKEVEISIERLISFENKNIAVIEYKVTPLNFNGVVKLISSLDGNVTNLTCDNDPRVGSGSQGRMLDIEYKKACNENLLIKQKTKNTKLSLICAANHKIKTSSKYKVNNFVEKSRVNAEFTFDGKVGENIIFDKYISYVTSMDFSERAIESIAKEKLQEAYDKGYKNLVIEQKKFLDNFWNKADIKITGDVEIQQGLRFNMFHLLQSAGRDGKTNIAAKGLSGEGYEGHYFWDTEMYMIPFFINNSPEISRKLLEYRFKILDKARQRAIQMGYKKGALYAWRTINGEECSAYYPAGTAQYHINADIAFAIKKYVEVTEDKEFLIQYGAEMLFETARFWIQLGGFIKRKGNKFCINCVTGPDEYTAMVNNNCYTNLMAKENLEYAYEIALWMKDNYIDVYTDLTKKISLEEDELKIWKKAADYMFIPYDEKLKIYMQDDSFLNKEVWDFKNTPKENYPLLIHYHPLVIYKYQVCKQADTVLVEFLLNHKFSEEQKKRDYDYYEAITTHDSSLSMCIFSIMANEVGYHEKAYNYFIKTARMDLDNIQGNTKDGIHVANMAGTWMAIVNGFAGMRTYDGVLSFTPYLPDKWESYSFKVNYKHRTINVNVNKIAVKYKLLNGENITIIHKGNKMLLEK